MAAIQRLDKDLIAVEVTTSRTLWVFEGNPLEFTDEERKHFTRELGPSERVVLLTDGGMRDILGVVGRRPSETAMTPDKFDALKPGDPVFVRSIPYRFVRRVAYMFELEDAHGKKHPFDVDEVRSIMTLPKENNEDDSAKDSGYVEIELEN